VFFTATGVVRHFFEVKTKSMIEGSLTRGVTSVASRFDPNYSFSISKQNGERP